MDEVIRVEDLEQVAAVGVRQPHWYNGPESGRPMHVHAGALGAIDKFQRARVEIDADKTLTPAGKSARLEEIATGGLRDLDALSAELAHVQRQRDTLREALQPSSTVKGLSEAVQIAREAEIRAALAQLDTLRVEQIYRDAIARGDTLTAVAIEGIPRFLDSALPAEVIAEGKELRAQSEMPERWAAYQHAREMAHDAEQALTHARDELASAVPGSGEPRTL